MTLSIPVPSRRTIGHALTLVVCMLAMSTGLHAQTPVESAAVKLVQIFVNITPYLATIAFIVGGVLLAIGHHSAHERLVSICFGAAVALGAISLVNYFR